MRQMSKQAEAGVLEIPMRKILKAIGLQKGRYYKHNVTQIRQRRDFRGCKTFD